MTKMKRPSRRDINTILKRNVFGWNDKRNGYNRIKLVERLKLSEVNLLNAELPKLCPGYKFLIEEHNWKFTGYGRYDCGRLVTTVKYSAI